LTGEFTVGKFLDMESPPTAPTAPNRRIDRRRALAREEFVEAAREVVAELGVRRFSLEQVARRVGLTKQAVYHYFDSKEGVLAEVAVGEMTRAAREVADAVSRTAGAADAMEAMIRSYFAAFVGRLRLFQLCYTAMPTLDAAPAPDAALLARLHPLNDLVLGGVAERVARERGLPADAARRLAFVAYTSVLGLLAMRALTEAASDPLRHDDGVLVDTLVATFRQAVTTGSPTP
jgi:AcrR family transcriptional regulator